jgi:elongation factor G
MNDPGKIRNIALVGHRGTGKTSLLEGLLYKAGVVNRLGHVVEGTTVSDYDDDEKRRQLSLSAGLAHIERKGLSFNLIDAPGDSSFLADTIASLRVVETALVVVNSVLGVEVQTERLWSRADERGLARILFCNMLDRERADFAVAVDHLREAFGTQVVAVEIPVGSEHEFKGVVDLFSMKSRIHEGDEVVEGDADEETEGDEEAEGDVEAEGDAETEGEGEDEAADDEAGKSSRK